MVIHTEKNHIYTIATHCIIEIREIEGKEQLYPKIFANNINDTHIYIVSHSDPFNKVCVFTDSNNLIHYSKIPSVIKKYFPKVTKISLISCYSSLGNKLEGYYDGVYLSFPASKIYGVFLQLDKIFKDSSGYAIEIKAA